MKKIIILIIGLALFSCTSTKDLGKMESKVETLEKEVSTLKQENKALTQAIIRLDERTTSIVNALTPANQGQQPQGEQVYAEVDVYPRYPKGDTALFLEFQKNFKFPENYTFEGEILTRFVVEKDGSLTNFTFSKDTPKDFAQEIYRVLMSMGKWTPGVLKGKVVRTVYNIPITIPKKEEKK